MIFGRLTHCYYPVKRYALFPSIGIDSQLLNKWHKERQTKLYTASICHDKQSTDKTRPRHTNITHEKTLIEHFSVVNSCGQIRYFGMLSSNQDNPRFARPWFVLWHARRRFALWPTRRKFVILLARRWFVPLPAGRWFVLWPAPGDLYFDLHLGGLYSPEWVDKHTLNIYEQDYNDVHRTYSGAPRSVGFTYPCDTTFDVSSCSLMSLDNRKWLTIVTNWETNTQARCMGTLLFINGKLKSSRFKNTSLG